MDSSKIGRNDSCPCGSGKKYKHCCLRRDRQRRRARSQQPFSVQEQLDQTLRVARQALRRAPPEQKKELQRLVDVAEEASAYGDMQAEIEAAMRTLEAHRAEFERLMANPAAAMARTETLFAEERFQPMRYTAADVQRAFEAVGFPTRYRDQPNEEVMETLSAAAVHLAGDELQRLGLSKRLMMLLPEYVAAGRYLDAWLIQYSAYRLVEVPGENNPFTFTMFNLAFQEWTYQIDEQQKDLLRQLDINVSRLKQMDFEEIEVWLQAQLADPKKESQLQAYLQTHPMLDEQTQAEVTGLHRDAVLLLERQDADRLYLSPEELDPWLWIFRERVTDQEALVVQAIERGESPDPAIAQVVQDTLFDLTQEMAAAIFTPQRLTQLMAEVRDYRRRLVEAGETKSALHMYMILTQLEREPSPAENFFLQALCFVSLRKRMRFMAKRGPADAGEETANNAGMAS